MAEIHKISIYQDIEGTEFPAGRRTRVLVGVDSPLQAEHYVVGTANVHPGGGVPEHAHETEETYIILSGTGEMIIDGEPVPIKSDDVIYLPPMQRHELKNTGDTEMRTIFVYAPKMVVEHWAQELFALPDPEWDKVRQSGQIGCARPGCQTASGAAPRRASGALHGASVNIFHSNMNIDTMFSYTLAFYA